jgi:Tfp pilus assembly protein PilF
VVKRNPNNPAALNNLAWAYQQEKDPRALGTAEQAFKLAGDNPGVLDTLGWMLVEQGNTHAACRCCRKPAAWRRIRLRSVTTWQSACINRATNRARARNSTNCLQKTSLSLN